MKYVAPKWSVLLNLTCSVCNDPSSYVDVTKNDLPKGILCERCHKILQLSVGTDNELLEKLALYKLINEKFPFWQRALIELRSNLKIENETPLLDFDK